MTDLRSRLHEVDGVRVPDLMDQVLARAARVTAEPAARAEPRKQLMRPLVAGSAAAVFVLAALLVVTALKGRDTTVASRSYVSWLTRSTGKCVESFSPGALADMPWAFDGTIIGIVPPKNPESDVPEDIVTQVTFRVNDWYKGGSGDTVTRVTYAGTDDPGASLGARMLVSGKGEYIWGCGFSTPYTEQNAKTFAEAFG